jgi:hypothetical protein
VLHAPKIVEELTVQPAPGGESGMILSYMDLIEVRRAAKIERVGVTWHNPLKSFK